MSFATYDTMLYGKNTVPIIQSNNECEKIYYLHNNIWYVTYPATCGLTNSVTVDVKVDVEVETETEPEIEQFGEELIVKKVNASTSNLCPNMYAIYDNNGKVTGVSTTASGNGPDKTFYKVVNFTSKECTSTNFLKKCRYNEKDTETRNKNLNNGLCEYNILNSTSKDPITKCETVTCRNKDGSDVTLKDVNCDKFKWYYANKRISDPNKYVICKSGNTPVPGGLTRIT